MTEHKSLKLNMELNSILEDKQDPTIMRATWILHDFNVSHNGVILTKEVSLEASSTILNKPILAYYNECSEVNTPTDSLGGHEEYIGIDRNGQQVGKSNTTPIGTIISEAYIMNIEDSNGATKEVMACDSILWLSRFPDACGLLMEWFDRGIKILSSCEYYYRNFTFEDGVIKVDSPVYYDGHCILNSEERDGNEIVKPAYDDSIMLSLNELKEFNKLVSQAIVRECNKEGEGNVSMAKVKSVNEESTEVEDKTKQVSAEGNENPTEEEPKGDEVEVTEVDKLKEEIEKLKAEIVKLKEEISVLKSEKETVDSEKSELSTKLTVATDKLTKLSKDVQELNSYKEKYDSEILEKAISEKKEYYEAKFKALNSASKFEEVEVQDLVKLSAEDTDEGNKAIMSLNSMLIDMVDVKEDSNKAKIIKEISSDSKTLINIENSFDSKYK